MRWFPVLCIGLMCVSFGGCSIPIDNLTERAPYVPPGAPSMSATIAGLKKAIAEEKLEDETEVSDVRVTDRGLGRYMVCLKGHRDREASTYYSVFFDNDEYKGVRESAISDVCAQQSFRQMAQGASGGKAN
jgi:hypothetical protein